MEDVVRKKILNNLDQVLKILQDKDSRDLEELKNLSDQAVEDVALHKDLDMISITVLIYSIYKILGTMKADDYNKIMDKLRFAKNSLKDRNLSIYNCNIKDLYTIINRSNAEVKTHLQDVMQAARIKKGTILLEHGLSIGQAAGLMGLSNWDLQQYAAKTTALQTDTETIPAVKRLQLAFQIFGVK